MGHSTTTQVPALESRMRVRASPADNERAHGATECVEFEKQSVTVFNKATNQVAEHAHATLDAWGLPRSAPVVMTPIDGGMARP
jgi:hypothetical protein